MGRVGGRMRNNLLLNHYDAERLFCAVTFNIYYKGVNSQQTCEPTADT